MIDSGGGDERGECKVPGHFSCQYAPCIIILMARFAANRKNTNVFEACLTRKVGLEKEESLGLLHFSFCLVH